MHVDSANPPDSQSHSAAAAFKYIVGGAALFIAGCSAFFSVSGLGLLFVGSAAAVMVMAASLELGKLVAASFLYRYWKQITIPLRIYLTIAVLILIGITSLGNYGYLARAYEQTNSQLGLLDQQIQQTQADIDDTQKRIDGSKADSGKASDVDRQDVVQLQQRIVLANQSMDQQLVRLDDRRKAAKDKHDRDVDLLNSRMKQAEDVMKQGLDSEEGAIAQLNDRVAGLDRAVDKYVSQGGPGFLKSDGVKKGQDLRDQQQPERAAIAAEIMEHQKKEDDLRGTHASAVDAINHDVAAADDQYKHDQAALDADDQSIRKARADSVADAEGQLKALQSQGQASAQFTSGEIEAMYQHIRSGNEDIRRLREQIAATDIGSYRFVARAFNAGADDVVKWLILVLVLVFDPLAVALTVGFNVALMRDRLPKAQSLLPEVSGSQEIPRKRFSLFGLGRGGKLVTGALAVALLVGLLFLGGYYGAHAYAEQSRTSPAAFIPADSFTVLTIHPEELSKAGGGQKLADLFPGPGAGQVSNALADLFASGFDQKANIYGFVKFPEEQQAGDPDHPVMIVGIIAKVTDGRTAEAGLSHFCDALVSALGKPSTADGGMSRSRAMVHYGRGRYLDPQGSFFSFALTDHEAIVLIELDGDPQHPTLENEIRLCLAPSGGNTPSYGKPVAKLPARALSGQGAVALWFDANAFFSRMPKNAAAQARYQQLQRNVGFDLLLTAQSSQPGQLELVADYAYATDRFRAGPAPTAMEILDKLGSADSAGVPGRLMDRCAATLDFDGLIDQLRTVLGKAHGNLSADQVLVEKTVASDREGKFVLTAHFDSQAGPPIVAALESLGQ